MNISSSQGRDGTVLLENPVNSPMLSPVQFLAVAQMLGSAKLFLDSAKTKPLFLASPADVCKLEGATVYCWAFLSILEIIENHFFGNDLKSFSKKIIFQKIISSKSFFWKWLEKESKGGNKQCGIDQWFYLFLYQWFYLFLNVAKLQEVTEDVAACCV